ncbi:MAG: serine/threonine protein kinase, partial [Leptolyngbya sp.]|nr:serine/threonine protein kinase [Candidatus Melainabacteria bacterium]
MDDQDEQNQHSGQSQNKSPTLSNDAQENRGEIDYAEIVADRYRIVSLLGHGGMGAVYKVEQIFLEQTFALKTLTAKNFSDIAIKRFQKEAQAAGKLTHPNLVRALDFGVLKNGNPFYVMDLVEGDNLAEYSRKIGSLNLEEVFKIFIPICFALGYAHTEGIIHRDIKPGNIMLAKTGNPIDPFVPKIVDFGIAKLTDAEDGTAVNLTQTGEIFGTPLYMSPEQCYGKKLDHRSDIYSLGCVLYEALTGAPPFTGESVLAVMLRHQSEEPASLKEA